MLICVIYREIPFPQVATKHKCLCDYGKKCPSLDACLPVYFAFLESSMISTIEVLNNGDYFKNTVVSIAHSLLQRIPFQTNRARN